MGMLEKGKKAIRAVISGYVQGVWFCDWAIQNAEKSGIDGWVRNRTDGTVEIMMVGDEDKVDQMIKLCWIGPSNAKVKNIDLFKALGITAKGFKQKPTVDLRESRNPT